VNLKKWLLYLMPAAGVVVLLAYFNITVFGIPFSERLALLLAFAIGPVAIIGVIQFHRQFAQQYKGSLLPTATAFLVIAFAFFNLMLVVQQSIFARYREALSSSGDGTRESLRVFFSLVNQVQLGIDVSFDIFYCVGLILLSIVLLHLSLSKKVVGAYGVVTGVGLLAFNMATFPVPPVESGLFDWGPATGLFWAALIVLNIMDRRAKPSRWQESH
jgi:hypothetical protein